jgi:hypothetical protein
MSSSTVLITDMAILVGIFLLGLLAKLFPKKERDNHSGGHTSLAGVSGQGSGDRDQG